MKKIILLAVGVILSLTTYSQTHKTIDWNADLDYLAKELPEKHYDFFTTKNKEEFLSGINAIKQECKNLTDFQVALKVQQLIAKFGDSHTMLNFNQLLNRGQVLPIHLFWTSEGLHILHTTPENEKLLGCELVSMNKVPITTVIDSLSTLFTIDNRAMVKLVIPQVISSLQILEYFGFTDTEQVELELKTTTNQSLIYTLKPAMMNRSNRISFKPDSLAFCVKNEGAFFTDFYSPDEKIYYLLWYSPFVGQKNALAKRDFFSLETQIYH